MTRRSRNARLSLESLESRRLLAIDGYLVAEEIDGNLYVNGSEEADFVLITNDHNDLGEELLVRIWDRHWGDADAVLLFEEDYDLEDVQHIYVYTFGGNDHVMVGLPISDTIYLGEGNDEAHGGYHDSTIYGEGGVDKLHGRQGVDLLYGGKEGDFLYGGEEGDTIYGEQGDDFINGESGSDILYGGSDNDTIHGAGGEDEIHGDSGDDILYGGNENDTLYGSWGYDTLFGAGGDDTLDGGSHGDELIGGSGSDTLNGGLGHDLLIAGSLNSYGPMNVVRDTWVAELRMAANSANLISPFANAVLPTFGMNTTYWNSNQIDSYSSSGIEAHESSLSTTDDIDYLEGDSGLDVFLGDDGRDYISDNDGEFWAFGAGGNDVMEFEDSGTAIGGSGNDTIRVHGWWNKAYGGSGNDKLYGGDSGPYDKLFGESGDDQLRGYAGDDWLGGGSGNDLLLGGDGKDYLYGGEGDDHLDGNGNNYGDARRDVEIDWMHGGAGVDTFSLYYGSLREVADNWRDFTEGIDQEFYSTGRATGRTMSRDDWYFGRT